ncbi:MAG: ornithine carbamoyltransferase [Syntrophomonadaceae bacterium]|jgi:ornithine carbamoyltransferase|nr:ornithine carbamoyltransferase [Syntrophomonadaceae bacterium]
MQVKLNPSFKGRDFIAISDYTTEEIFEIFDVARQLKKLQHERIPHHLLAGKTLGMIFQKPSTRTRVSFETGIYYLGGYGLFLSPSDLQMGRGETIKDTALTLSRYLDGIMIRTFDHEEVLELAHYASIPVINGLTDLMHPCQVMGDLLTALEYKGGLSGLKCAYIGDGNNMCHSLLEGGARVGMHVTVACPPGFEPEESILSRARQEAQATGARLEVIEDPWAAVAEADLIYTDVWASMGQEKDAAEKEKHFARYQVNSKLVAAARPDVIVMHCLPAKRGREITDEVMDGRHSVVFDEAENRLHAQKAIMALLMQ